MRKAELTIPKRYEHLLQFVDLANLLAPRIELPRIEWPTPEEIAQLGARMGRDEDWFEVGQQRSAILEPFWKEAARRFPPIAADRLDLFGDLRTLRGQIVVFRRPTADLTLRLFTFALPPEPLYEAAYTVRAALRTIARAAMAQRKDAIDLALPMPRIRAQILPGGIIRTGADFYRDFFLDALDGFDARRIRECPECLRLFIARREDQSACGSPAPCANRLRQREFRKSHPAYHKRHERSARTRTFRATRIEPLEFLRQQEA